ncbi:cadmium-translocating P-type ATPase [Aliifodinibius sp. 1BSP15-2V2]|uniref:P-type Zn(2+) transporter n=2 Tax=Fodinibius salsisoli TaxID=2820877 RepID=A0ABT3PRD7_9BACT|nr:cadmium-translocating P-type ATPase [Fodinibius salsisoli]
MTLFFKKYKEVISSSVLLAVGLIAEFVLALSGYIYLPLYILSYLVVGGPVWVKAFKSIAKGTIFSEFLLMGIATVGAFAIGEYAEGVAVMLFYMIGEHVQHGAVHRAKHSIRELINQQPDIATVERSGSTEEVHPSEVAMKEIIQVKPGEKVPLDGLLLTDKASFNTAALTGESKPMSRESGEEVWAGSINQDTPVRIRVTSDFQDTKLSSILEMVQEASQRKAPTQRFIARFAAVYTPIVVWLAVALTFMPYLLVENYIFQDWFYRALIFLVVSCPCGLVISIPLGYFGGIGAASQNGILLKGSDFLDQLRKMDTLFVDKTGTLTKGNFEVQDINSLNGFSKDELLTLAASLEQQSTHPVAKAILSATNGQILKTVHDQQEVSGKGVKGIVDQQEIVVGNRGFLLQHGIQLDENSFAEPHTFIHVAVDRTHAGTISIADQIKPDSKQAVAKLKEQGIGQIAMLSGDNQRVVDYIASELGLDEAYGDLLPDEKYRRVERALASSGTVGFVGDGINDAPVITLADVGLAMGGIGSDATIETADVVIQTDQPSKIPLAVDIAHFTHRIVWQNIVIALGIKVGIMALAVMGYASMWAAIFADVGVALIAIGNAVRVQHRFSDSTFSEMMTSTEIESSTDDQEAQPCCDSCSV